MSDDLQQRERATGRSYVASAYGASPDALETAALNEAHEFFGPEVRLEVVTGYKVFPDHMASPERRYHASVTVQEIKD